MQTLKEFRVEFDFILHSGTGTLDNVESNVLSLVVYRSSSSPSKLSANINIITKSSSTSTEIFCQNPKVKPPIFHVHKKRKIYYKK